MSEPTQEFWRNCRIGFLIGVIVSGIGAAIVWIFWLIGGR